MATPTPKPDSRVLLPRVSWGTYERLVDDLSNQSAPRLVFDRGTLEIMSPTAEHEELNRLLSSLVEAACEILGLDYRSLGSTTFKRDDLLRGFEPDSCFYIQNVDRIKAKKRISLPDDPPPDLVIEVDITSTSIDKLPIYAAIGVNEVWRHDGSTLRIYHLDSDRYISVDQSRVLAPLGIAEIGHLVEASRSMARPAWVQTVRREVSALVDRK
jgi:Uma2 family endonuclease